MNELSLKAKEYQDDIAMRAKAHEGSAEWHRWRGEVVGNAATIVSAIVGTAIFGALAVQLGAGGKGALSLPAQGWPLLAAILVCFLSVLAPVLNAVQTRMNDTAQAATHRACAAAYYRLEQKLDAFRLRYADETLASGDRDQALKDLDSISSELLAISGGKDYLTLTDRAIADAKQKLGR